MNVRRDIRVYIDGDYWNYYTGHVVYERVEWMMPREYYKDKDEWVYNFDSEWFKGKGDEARRFDMERFGMNQDSMTNVMKDYGKFCEDWSTFSGDEKTDEPVGVYLDKEPYYSTQEDRNAYTEYWREQECGLD